MNKILIALCVVLAVVAQGYAATIRFEGVDEEEVNPDLDGEISDSAWDCILQSIDALESTNPDLSGWFANFRATVGNLRTRRTNCLEIANQTLQDRCMQAWSASLAIELLRLRNDLNNATDRGGEVWGELSAGVAECRSENPVDGGEFARALLFQ